MDNKGFKNKYLAVLKSNKGQTLIETLAAVFILAMGMTASAGLAIFALNSSGGAVKQIIATGLAREGLEAVRNMRDTNWLKDTLVPTGCYNFSTGTDNNSPCYVYWLGRNSSANLYCLNPSPGASCNGNSAFLDYYVGFDSSSSGFWIFDNARSKYGINFVSSGFGGGGFYSEDGNTDCVNATSDYCRSVTLTKLNTSPYSHGDFDNGEGVLLFVQSKVWWVDKKCPRVNLYNNAAPACRLELDTYLTNWKNY